MTCPMSQPEPQLDRSQESAPTAPEAFLQAMRSELARRISELATYSATDCGPLGARDLFATLALFVLAPIFLVWMMR